MPDPAPTAPGPLRGRLLVAILVTVLVGLVGVAIGVTSGPTGDEDRRAPSSSPAAATTPPPTGTTPTTPADIAGFPSSTCAPATVAADSALGLGLPRPARLAQPGPEQSAFTAALGCLQRITGRTPILRTQLPIDALRRTSATDDERSELTAFAALLVQHGAPGVVSIRSHDFTACGSGDRPEPEERTSLAAGEALGRCQYPSPELYRQLFAEIANAVAAAAPNAALQYTAWNEPDHPDFTLEPALGRNGAARRAGEYWTQAAAVVGADHVLAGEFADHDLATLLTLRGAFVEGTGGVAPLAWAIHPYRDLTAGSGFSVLDGFAKAVAPAPVWDTEVTPRLSGEGGLTGDPSAQFARGGALRSALAAPGRRVVLYLLTPPPPPATRVADHWDSALADREGRARPFVCGLAGLPAADCPGDPAAYG
ncbi:MAG: hypothetical protein AAGC46_04245 [Solirubrobacteraceae bacterium]|nr:hypothetical protein [Patulibacter sp.]